MSNRFRPYPNYQQSGLPWLGRVPKSWKLRRLGGLFRERREKVSDDDFPALSVTMQGIVPQLENAAKTKDGDNRKLVRTGDFAINSRSDRKGSSGVSGLDGSVSLITIVLEPYGLHPAFVHHLLRSEAFQEEFYRYGKGIVADLWSTNYSAMKNITIPVMSEDEQQQIAAFLDYETAKIDALIEKQQQLIALLGEKRQAVISHAVTKGLNPDAPMRDSGIEWLGQVPEHWRIGPLKRFWPVIDCKHVTVPFLDEGYPVASVMEVRTFELDLSGVLRTDSASFGILKGGGREPKQGDVIYCRNTANTGTSAYVWTDEPICIGQDVVLIKSRTQNGRFLNYILHGPEMAVQLAQYMVGSTFKRINVADIRELIVTCPPRTEQDKIVEYLDAKSSQFDDLIGNSEEMVEALRERRVSLISAAVTGKIDVRGWRPPASDVEHGAEMEMA